MRRIIGLLIPLAPQPADACADAPVSRKSWQACPQALLDGQIAIPDLEQGGGAG